MKLRGNPWWTSSGDQINQSRMLACALLSAMDLQGFELLGSVDMSMGAGENQSECECGTAVGVRRMLIGNSGYLVFRR